MINQDQFAYLLPQLIHHRRYLHIHPEVGFYLPNTHDFVASILGQLKIPFVPHVGKYSLVGTIENGVGPVIGLRADMDALPMEEANKNIPYCSQKPGMMHACGHDAHTAILLSVADYLVHHKNQWKGTVQLIFQEAEEGPEPGGAEGIVKSGLVDNVDCFFGLHCGPQYPANTFAIKDLGAMASADTIRIKLIGKGAHAAYPHLGVDPIVMQAELILAIQSIPTRMIDPTEPCVITIAQVHSGSTHNIIPESAFLEGTVRAFNQDVRKKIEKSLEIAIKSVTLRHGGSYEYQYVYGYDALINQPQPTNYLKKIIKTVFGNEALTELSKPSMGAEDFSKYINHRTGCMVWLGTGSTPETKFGLHHPRFDVDEAALINGVSLFVNLVHEYHTIEEK